MGFEVSYREHKLYAALNPDFTFTKPTGTLIRVTTTMASLGRGYLFFVVDRVWLHNKYIRWRWQGSYSHTFSTWGEIWDGEFVRSSMVDFPNGAPPITKGNGILQTLDLNSGSFAMETKDVQADTSGGSETKCTIIFWTHDSWNGQSGLFQMDWIEVNEGAGGADNINTEHFTDAIVPEVGGTLNDYGYIGTGPVISVLDEELPGEFIVRGADSEDLAAGFEVRQGSQDLAAVFEVGQGTEELPVKLVARQSESRNLAASILVVIPGSENLPAELIVRSSGSANLLGEFIVRQAGSQGLAAGFDTQIILDLATEFIVRPAGLQDLPGEFIVRQAGSQDLAASFDGQVSLNLPGAFVVRRDALQDLPGEFIVRQSGSQDLAASFEGQVRLNLPAEFVSRQAGSQNLLGEFIVRQAGSQDLAAGFAVRRTAMPLELKAGFQIAWYSVDLLGNIYVRPTASRATDFEVKDNTRGLTVRDVDRTMTVTAGRRMRVK